MSRKIGTFGIAVVFGLVACGGGGGGSSKSFSDLKGKFDNPTGDLGADNAKSVAAALQEEQKNSQGMGKLGLSSVQGAQSDQVIDCSGASYGSTSVTCTCNGGGSVSFDASSMTGYQEGDPISMAYEYDTCKMEEGGCFTTVNGTGWYLTSGAGAEEYCFAFDGTVENCEEPKTTMSIQFCYLEGAVWYLVEVDNGVFAVTGSYSDTDSFEFRVKDKDGEWICSGSAGHGTCSGPGGQSVEF